MRFWTGIGAYLMYNDRFWNIRRCQPLLPEELFQTLHVKLTDKTTVKCLAHFWCYMTGG